MITAKKDMAKLSKDGKFISFVKEGYDYDTEMLFHVEDIDFTLDEYANIPRHKCVKCSQEEWDELILATEKLGK